MRRELLRIERFWKNDPIPYSYFHPHTYISTKDSTYIVFVFISIIFFAFPCFRFSLFCIVSLSMIAQILSPTPTPTPTHIFRQNIQPILFFPLVFIILFSAFPCLRFIICCIFSLSMIEQFLRMRSQRTASMKSHSLMVKHVTMLMSSCWCHYLTLLWIQASKNKGLQESAA